MGLFIDFSKAFDYLHYSILTKLAQYGVRGVALQLLIWYLSHGKQYVSINGYSSGTCPLKAGVSQGSILGPLLFNFYVNDIIQISDTANFIIYAADTSIFFFGVKTHSSHQ